jgi:ketose-bisphosphate aldolase
MLTRFTDLLAEHDRARTALGAFTCYDLEETRGVLAAAAARDVGVVLLISRDAFAVGGGDVMAAAIRAAAERSPARACLQLDHVADLELIAGALELGVGAVMADGSRLPFDENVELVEAAKRLADESGAAVEAELGHVAGGEDVAVATEAGGLTDIEEAKRFVEATGVDLLAISIGNVHGKYASEPQLDWDLLEQLEAAVATPLSLHGASGLPNGDLSRAVGTGIRKVNANTELREAYLNATRDGLDAALDGFGLMDLHHAQSSAVRAVVEEKVDALRAPA